MEILPAGFRDLGQLRRLERDCFQGEAWSLFDLVAVLTWPEVVRLKAVERGEMIGFVAGDPRRSEGFGWIATIGVAPRFRRRGIGRGLLQACETNLGLPRIKLTVRLSNHAAITLYEREGYRTVDVWARYYGGREDAVLMQKERSDPGAQSKEKDS
jgi:ribosomal-protein-alanine N-acetyltransferase